MIKIRIDRARYHGCDTRLTATGRSPEDHGRDSTRFYILPEWSSHAKKMFLSDDVIEGFGAQE